MPVVGSQVSAGLIVTPPRMEICAEVLFDGVRWIETLGARPLMLSMLVMLRVWTNSESKGGNGDRHVLQILLAALSGHGDGGQRCRICGFNLRGGWCCRGDHGGECDGRSLSQQQC